MNASLWTLALVAALGCTATLLLWRRRQPATQPTPTRPPVTLTRHAREQMAKRCITTDQVNTVLASPERAVPCPRNGSVRLERRLTDRTLKVWVAAPHPSLTSAPTTVKSAAWAPHEITFKIPAQRVGLVIGKKGATVKRFAADTGARIRVGSDGTVHASSNDPSAAQSARRQIENLVNRPRRQTRAPRVAAHQPQVSGAPSPTPPSGAVTPAPAAMSDRNHQSKERIRNHIDRLLDRLQSPYLSGSEISTIQAKIEYCWSQINRLDQTP